MMILYFKPTRHFIFPLHQLNRRRFILLFRATELSTPRLNPLTKRTSKSLSLSSLLRCDHQPHPHQPPVHPPENPPWSQLGAQAAKGGGASSSPAPVREQYPP
uniref:Uncharacterized protein n=1 Tax=Opuntia streptacantha TaxID=393608 RepID=A0A7C9CLG3_OPUST